MENIEFQKELARAENLSEEEQAKIAKEAQKTVSKKVRGSEAKIENEMVSLL